jgi:cholesterol oxidase
MNEMPVGLRFHETMAGGFTLGAGDPAEGHSEGELGGSTLTMRCTVEIPDLDQFVDGPEHQATLRASVDIPALGTAIAAPRGTLHLFEPSDEPGVRLLRYRLHFTVDEQPYLLEGKKFIRDGSCPRDLWDQSRTLYTRLHAGEDEHAPVAGAGILSIDVQQTIDLAASMRVTNTRSPVRKAEALARFGKLVLGELWGAYRGHEDPGLRQTSTR